MRKQFFVDLAADLKFDPTDVARWYSVSPADIAQKKVKHRLLFIINAI